ncbi:MAG: patatin-like phospholipase family protein [Myxococcota bacterium]
MNKNFWNSPSSDVENDPFAAVVFAGGGCRCFWQAGFWSVVSEAIPAPRVVLGVSAGVAFACVALLGRGRQVLEDFKGRATANERNFYPGHFGRVSPVFPHEEIYRATITTGLRDGDFERLQQGPDLRILLARAPHGLGGRSSFLLGGVAYALDKYEERIHSRWGSLLGFGSELISVRDCSTQQELVELILQSSCTPPLLPFYRRDDCIVFDGGLVDNAPADMVPEGSSTLVLLTRQYSEVQIPDVPGRTYVCPSSPIPVVKWDYTSPELVQQTWDLGCSDGEAFASRYRSGTAALEREAAGNVAVSA